MADANLEKLYFRGKEAFERRNYDYAIDLFRQILSLQPDHLDARRALRICEVKKCDEIGYPSKLTLFPLKAKTETQIKFNQKNREKIIEICEAHLARDPKNIGVRIALAQALLSLGHTNGAMAELEMARDIQPDHVEALRLLGEVYGAQDKIPEARACITKAIQIKPDDRLLSKALNDLEAKATMAKGYEAQDYRGAMRDKDQAANMEAEHHMVKTGDEVQDEVQRMDEQIAAAGTEREKVKLLKKKGELLEQSGDRPGARQAYLDAQTIDAADTMLKDKIEDLAIKEKEEAIQAVTEQSKAKPDDAALQARVKQLRLEKLKLETAAWERRVKDRPTDIKAHFELGRRYYLSGLVDRAVAEFQHTVKDPKLKVESHLYLGMAFRHKRMFDLAATQFAKALEGGELALDRELNIRYELSKTLENSGNAQKALEEYKKILEQDINYKDVAQRVEELQKKLGQ